MKERILKGWTLARVLYFSLGLFIIVQSIINEQYFGIPFGAYFAAMGLFAFGCASGRCHTPYSGADKKQTTADPKQIEFQEVDR